MRGREGNKERKDKVLKTRSECRGEKEPAGYLVG